MPEEIPARGDGPFQARVVTTIPQIPALQVEVVGFVICGRPPRQVLLLLAGQAVAVWPRSCARSRPPALEHPLAGAKTGDPKAANREPRPLAPP
jgi:hypothetical protein